MKWFTAALSVLLFLASSAGGVQDQGEYVRESDLVVRERLDQWQDLKLGLLMHWGHYGQWGIVESWSICAEDEPCSNMSRCGVVFSGRVACRPVSLRGPA
jgi:hypothetical protein